MSDREGGGGGLAAQFVAAEQVVLKLKTPWRDGTTQLAISPLEFMQRLASLVQQTPHEGAQAAQPAQCEANCAHHGPVRLSWARLLKRVFELDLEQCPNCGGELKIIAAILEQPVIEKILTHLGLQARAPPRSAARGQALQAA